MVQVWAGGSPCSSKMDGCSVYDNGYLDWLFYQNVFPLKESSSIMSGNSKRFTLVELFRSAITEL